MYFNRFIDIHYYGILIQGTVGSPNPSLNKYVRNKGGVRGTVGALIYFVFFFFPLSAFFLFALVPSSSAMSLSSANFC